MSKKLKKRRKNLRGFLRNESGATAIEYGLIVSLIFLAITAAVKNFSTKTNAMYNNISANLSNP